MKPKLKIAVNGATHFLRWEIPHLQKHFDLVEEDGKDTILLVFGPDALLANQHVPASIRAAVLFPGFGWNPYHDLDHRAVMSQCIQENYDLIFINPGIFERAFAHLPQIRIQPFSLDADLVICRQYRTKIQSLLHASADYPQKDWRRSQRVMKLTGLRNEVYPPRQNGLIQRIQSRLISRNPDDLSYKINWRLKWLRKKLIPHKNLQFALYRSHKELVRKMQTYDGFVHVAGETPPYVDGKYTATLLEAGLTGAILFWHDTFNLGNDFETVFNLPLDPVSAADQIREISRGINVEQHSRLTREEILDRCSAQKVIEMRAATLKALL
jgi:hypothetical protein